MKDREGGLSMAILPIVLHPSSILETKCDEVENFNQELKDLLDQMYETMVNADGVGLAAPQIGVNKQIAIVEVEEGELIEMINPKIRSGEGENIDIEGCLSFPGIYGTVARKQSIVLQAQNRFGEYYTIEAEDYTARAIQHEIDHLEGILFTSKIIEYIDEADLEEEE